MQSAARDNLAEGDRLETITDSLGSIQEVNSERKREEKYIAQTDA